MFRSTITLVLAALLLVIVAPGCDSSGPEPGDQPTLFPGDVFSLETDLFNATAEAKDAFNPGINFASAALRVWPVSFIIAVNLVIPTVVTAAALQADPRPEEGQWVWTSSANHDGTAVTFSLAARPISGGHAWTSTVSFFDEANQIVLEDFVLFTGQTFDNGTRGNWQLFYPDQNGQSRNIINATFTRSSMTDKSITFTVSPELEAGGGDTITHTVDGDTRTFTWVEFDSGATHVVTWDHMTHEGSITSTSFNDGVQACWDADLNNASLDLDPNRRSRRSSTPSDH
jgi:hypothetical protein